MKYIFEVRIQDGRTAEEYTDAWVRASEVIQQALGALGAKLHRKIDNPIKKMTGLLAAAVIAGGLASAAPVQANEDVVIVYDASGSMWGQIDGVSKMEIAQDVMADLINEWDESTPLGLVAYGHRRRGDCSDIETLIEPGTLDKASFIDTFNAIKPKGKTPISASLQHAADLLSYRDSQATIILISDGLETCNADPCAVSEQLAKQGVRLTAHVVGFDLETDAHESLSCIANNTGGIFVPANSADELHSALDQVQSVMEQSSAEPEPEPEPALPEVTITAPEQVTTGAEFDVNWSDNVASDDYYTIVPTGADESKTGDRGLVRDKRQGTLRAPADPGLYEVRYLLREGMTTLASAPVEVVEAELSISAPEQVTTGAVFDVSWSDIVASDDYYTIVPMGTDEGKTGNRGLVRDKRQGTLKAPAEPGLYEVRYLLREGMTTLASAPVEVVEAELSINAPGQVTTGAEFDVSWSDIVASDDYYTIVPMGTDEGKTGNRGLVRDKRQGTLKAPAEPGLYEVRYLLREGMTTLASAPVEVVEAELSISAPEQVTTGAEFDVSWSDNVASDDYYTIVPAGTDEGKTGNRGLVRDKRQGTLKAPADPGLYEVRYLLREGMKTLASAPVEVVEAEISISAPDVVRAGTPIKISWSDTVASDDYYTIVPAGAGEGTTGDRGLVRDKREGTLTAPDETGLYEVRYLLREGMKTLASATLEIVGADAPLDDGAGLSVPKTATAGEVITITWSGDHDSTDQRISLARKDQPDFSWISVQSIGGEKTMDLTMPEETGVYEVRFLDIAGRELLGRSVIEVN